MLASNFPERHSPVVNNDLPQRHAPAKGVHVSLGGPNWVFLTVCTEQRERWLIQPFVQRTLEEIWRNTATAWLVSDYLLMPDHLHLFCAPHALEFTIERWIGFWKDRFAKQIDRDALPRVHPPAAQQRRPTGLERANQIGIGRDTLPSVRSGADAPTPCHETRIAIGKFQRGGFHHRLRDEESYREKWLYVQENPVRAGLVTKPEDWPYQGRVHEIHW